MLGHGKKFARLTLRFFGVCLYQLGLAKKIISLNKRTRAVLYHAVENNNSTYTKGLGVSVSPATFALHLDYFQKYYQVISMKDYLAEEKPRQGTAIAPLTKAIDNESRLCDKHHPQHQNSCNPIGPNLLITFDDGYASVMEHALPLLEQRKMAATVYLIGNAVRGQMVWVNRLNQAMNEYPGQTREVLDHYAGFSQLNRASVIHRIQTTFAPQQIRQLIAQLESSIPDLTRDKQKLFSTPDDIRAMQHRRIEFGFHTNDHWNLGKCKDSELVATLVTDGLEDLVNSNTFAYPFGYFAPSAIGRLTRQGYQKLMTVGSNNDQYSDLHLDRTELFETSAARLFSRLEVEEPCISALTRWAKARRSQARELVDKGHGRAA